MTWATRKTQPTIRNRRKRRKRVGETIVVLLVGGDKSTQQNDINRAINLWKEYKNDAERYKRDFSG